MPARGAEPVFTETPGLRSGVSHLSHRSPLGCGMVRRKTVAVDRIGGHF